MRDTDSMEITRGRAETRRVRALAAELAAMPTPCVGCRNCRGLCLALIEAIVLPDIILGGHREAP